MSRINIRYYKAHPPRLLTPLERQSVAVYRAAMQSSVNVTRLAERIRDAFVSAYDNVFSNPEFLKQLSSELKNEQNQH